ncbi:MAG: nickel pincer cofactor biosynthesis protein LarC [Oscillospiraceae bacterium]|nr:nickel pincer cofactor biosynthesis protein LarC [Oscillospiraceae bacterium]
MKLYLECSMGAAGDMIMSALYELLPDKQVFREKMERLNIPNVSIEYVALTKGGIAGTRIAVKIGGEEEKSEDVPQGNHHNETKDNGKNKQKKHAHSHHDHDHGHDNDHDHHTHEHSHEHSHHHPHGRMYGYNDILDQIRALELPDNVLENALGVYEILGHAEASVHGESLDKIHLHEVGSLDAIVDIVGCSILIEMLGVEEIVASPVHVGYGSVRCAHGILPVPAPAAAEILKDIPIYAGNIEGELCTPTGAALLKRFVTRFGAMPPMMIKKIGYGMGSKDFESVNCIRAFLYEGDVQEGGEREVVFEVSCNLDDMSPEAIGAAFEILFENGALDVYTTPIMMKKNRQAVMLSCLCREELRDGLVRLMLEHTTTLGVRVTKCRRDVMPRTTATVSTEYGDIRIKVAHGFGIAKKKPEYDDVRNAAKRHGIAYKAVYDAALRATLDTQGEYIK